MNLDGHLDFVSAPPYSSSGNVYVHVADPAAPAGTFPFGPPVSVVSRSEIWEIGVGDCNGDEIPDVVLLFRTDIGVYAGGGTPQAPTLDFSGYAWISAGDYFRRPHFVDLDRDGLLDLAGIFGSRFVGVLK